MISFTTVIPSQNPLSNYCLFSKSCDVFSYCFTNNGAKYHFSCPSGKLGYEMTFQISCNGVTTTKTDHKVFKILDANSKHPRVNA